MNLLECQQCSEFKLEVKFDKMNTLAGRVRRKTCRKCTKSGNGRNTKVLKLALENLKKCTSCKKVKSYNDFVKQSNSKDGLSPKCKPCWITRNKVWREDNPEKNKEIQQKYYQNNKESICFRIKQWRSDNKERTNLYRVERRKNDLEYKIKYYIRSRLYKVLTRDQKIGSFIGDLGCSIGDLKNWLEQQFQPGMTWENYSKNGWHIDHIIPLAYFDLTDRKQFKKACHWFNLRPLWAKDNLRKGSKIF